MVGGMETSGLPLISSVITESSDEGHVARERDGGCVLRLLDDQRPLGGVAERGQARSGVPVEQAFNDELVVGGSFKDVEIEAQSRRRGVGVACIAQANLRKGPAWVP